MSKDAETFRICYLLFRRTKIPIWRFLFCFCFVFCFFELSVMAFKILKILVSQSDIILCFAALFKSYSILVFVPFYNKETKSFDTAYLSVKTNLMFSASCQCKKAGLV